MLRFVYLCYLKAIHSLEPQSLPFVRDDWRIRMFFQSTNRRPLIEDAAQTELEDVGQIKQVHWADAPEVRIVERYDVRGRHGYGGGWLHFDDREDDEEDLYKPTNQGAKRFRESFEESSERSMLRNSAKINKPPLVISIPRSMVIEEAKEEEDFDPPFPSRSLIKSAQEPAEDDTEPAEDDTESTSSSTDSDNSVDYQVRIQELHDIIDEMQARKLGSNLRLYKRFMKEVRDHGFRRRY